MQAPRQNARATTGTAIEAPGGGSHVGVDGRGNLGGRRRPGSLLVQRPVCVTSCDVSSRIVPPCTYFRKLCP